MRSRTATLLLAVLVLSLCASVVQAKKNRTRRGIATRTQIYQFNSYRTDYVAKSGANVILATETYAIKGVFKGVFAIRFVRTDGNAAKRVKARMNCLAADGTSVLDVETPSADRTDIFYNHGGTVNGYDLVFPPLPQTTISKGATCVFSLEVLRGKLERGNWEFQLLLTAS